MLYAYDAHTMDDYTPEQIAATFKINNVSDAVPTMRANYVYTVEGTDGMLAVFTTYNNALNYASHVYKPVIIPWLCDVYTNEGYVYVLHSNHDNRPVYVSGDREVIHYVQYHLGTNRHVWVDNVDSSCRYKLDYIHDKATIAHKSIDINELLELAFERMDTKCSDVYDDCSE